ncbi:hypothetical protein HHU12_04060 [Flammeovirga aprica JL-4]|uniref:Uncharacterized protein n=2 Tax=Flammeovirga aprica TaxID=29528 RepID=A0A7X9P089_9BACT|nr:hypothetical protein [Flammeovirga aprica JL-4]
MTSIDYDISFELVDKWINNAEKFGVKTPKKIVKEIKRTRKLVEAGYDVEDDQLMRFIGQSKAPYPLIEDFTLEKRKELLLKFSIYDNLLFKFYDPQKDI